MPYDLMKRVLFCKMFYFVRSRFVHEKLNKNLQTLDTRVGARSSIVPTKLTIRIFYG